MSIVCDACGDLIGEDCECMVCDSDCIAADGKGETGREFTFSPTIDPDPDNLASCGASGLLAELPSHILTPPGCQVYHSLNQSVTNDVDLEVAFNSERYDNDSMHDNVTDNDRVIFNTAGVYVVTFNGSFAANAAGDRKAAIYKNGSTQIGHVARVAASASFATGLSLTIVEAFQEDDVIRVRVRQDSGGALNLVATRYSPILAVRFLRTLPEELL